MVNSNTTNYKYIYQQAVMLLLIISLPLHFFINSELENSRLKAEKAMKNYAEMVSNRIYRFSNSNESEFYFPRSNIFESGIYDRGNRKIFSLLAGNVLPQKGEFYRSGDYLYLKSRLKENVFGADYLIVEKRITHAKLIQNVLAILIVSAVLIFLMLLVIIKQSAEPYRRFNTYMENFIKDAMHEMKTPIGVILLNIDGLSAIYENNTMIQRAKSALKNMMVVYDDLEFFVRNSRVEHTKQKINLSDFIKERILFFSDLLDSKKIKIVQEIDSGVEITFSTLELSRIIDNTISNAIKYSKEETTIRVSLEQGNHKAILRIKDQGKGIADIKRIFERYYRGDKISGGFGIGLSIVKTICDQNGVTIEVDSRPEGGSMFVYAFPAKVELVDNLATIHLPENGTIVDV